MTISKGRTTSFYLRSIPELVWRERVVFLICLFTFLASSFGASIPFLEHLFQFFHHHLCETFHCLLLPPFFFLLDNSFGCDQGSFSLTTPTTSFGTLMFEFAGIAVLAVPVAAEIVEADPTSSGLTLRCFAPSLFSPLNFFFGNSLPLFLASSLTLSGAPAHTSLGPRTLRPAPLRCPVSPHPHP